MGGPGLEVAKFTLYVFMPIGFMVYFGGPGFYERYVAEHVYNFAPPPRRNLPTETSDIKKALEESRLMREQRKLVREQAMKEMRSSLT
ncbi:hypothetical protein LPJ77_003244 [Coemansia sp. RSA 2523]|nr:hypothetical protein LPJ54_002815 [Coemansia sp. RSA 1824]KAJ1782622.1 hypothetical protein LPJ62_005378 [Coemansia sp. RSA 2167]KAJ1790677.1 hypothetical protein LPJ67_002086 [Coemansia sp. RSA 1938]KAJ1807062.1 hypothetical protein LPJ77_003244 [Coemansia sp. RSA 2523]KAJ2121008.1 hypothetical protein GGH17_005448 [Coemansia sp. RSA 788]KAJ2146698.1 hypothetical protein IW142_001953 [Coemansia sp. RSA 564]KAJ2192609.1 hypothetical protein IW144_004806 [Coemansia sp. RSA 522]KAJ2207116.1